ncbi:MULTISPECIES: Crp/Fnr family transcriptional regulator [unclassified Acidovorax]|uniref:Crp/Fnr family transcriptional regulator n=1 Tax=unclassified Acidovorax TaxID=2684926 RepID=UPI0028834258|nr:MULTISPECIES: Crp/Fnr family transcriptional regulator [unclassified Acidovorax]
MTQPAPDRKACPDCACRQHCLLGRQDAAVRAAWEPHVRERRFRKGEVLQRQGDVLAAVQVVKVGTVLLQRSAGDGVDRPVGMAGCGQALGTAALLQQPAELSCVAVMPGRVCEIEVAPLWPGKPQSSLLDAAFLRDLAVDQLHAHALTADWARILRVRGSVGQLAGALLLLATLQRSTLVRLPSHAVLAGLLTTTRETVARGMALLIRQGALLRQDRWHCELVRDRLTELARGQRPVAQTVMAAAAAATPACRPPPARAERSARQAGLGSLSSACTSAASA